MCYNVKRMCIKSSPRREGSDYRDTPQGFSKLVTADLRERGA